MNYEQQFLNDFEEWLTSQISINELAIKQGQAIADEDQDERAREAVIRYESRLDAYQFLLGKFDNYHNGKSFHDLPDGLFEKRTY